METTLKNLIISTILAAKTFPEIGTNREKGEGEFSYLGNDYYLEFGYDVENVCTQKETADLPPLFEEKFTNFNLSVIDEDSVPIIFSEQELTEIFNKISD